MHYEISYEGLGEKEADKKAIVDILEYLGTDKVALFGDLVALAVCVENEIPCKSNSGELRKQTVQGLNLTMAFGGISGRPFHAFCRRYCPGKYEEWKNS